MDEGETVIGEESSRKGKRGGGEALEAPGSTWCTRYRYITLATPRRPHSFSLSPSSRLSACLPHTCPLFTLFLFRSSARKVAERERGKRKGRPLHDRSAKLKAHKPFYMPTRESPSSACCDVRVAVSSHMAMASPAPHRPKNRKLLTEGMSWQTSSHPDSGDPSQPNR